MVFRIVTYILVSGSVKYLKRLANHIQKGKIYTISAIMMFKLQNEISKVQGR